MRTVGWDDMTWLNPPPRADVQDGDLVVETGLETDFWQTTSYGFVHDDGHFLGAPLPQDAAIEVTFEASFSGRFDQAGLMLRAGPELWLKAGVELSDGELMMSAVVTLDRSDWSVTPLPPGSDATPFTIRASRSGDAVTLRYRVEPGDDWQLLRVAYLPSQAELLAGPMCCSPTRAGLSVRFAPVRVGAADAQLHPD